MYLTEFIRRGLVQRGPWSECPPHQLLVSHAREQRELEREAAAREAGLGGRRRSLSYPGCWEWRSWPSTGMCACASVHCTCMRVPSRGTRTLGHEACSPRPQVSGRAFSLLNQTLLESAVSPGPCGLRGWASLSTAARLRGERAAHPAVVHRDGRRPATEAARLLPSAPDHWEDRVHHQPRGRPLQHQGPGNPASAGK